MSLQFVVGLRACCVAFVLLATLHAGEPPHPLLGATRDQLLSRFGEPRSQLSAGEREVWFYPRERLVMINGVVVEVERLTADSTPTPSRAAESSDQPGRSSDSPTAPSAPSGDSKLEIRLVRPSSGTPPPSAQKSSPPPSSTPPAAEPAIVTPSRPPVTRQEAVPEVVPTEEPPAPALVPQSAELSPDATPPGDATPAAARPPVPAPKQPGRAEANDTSKQEDPSSSFAMPALIATGVLIAGLIGFLIWRSRQRQLELAASAVENTPVGPAANFGGSTVFTPEYLSQLDASRFEGLVADYYSKTGVIATRTGAGAASPVHIKISWKGESRPFALVHCISHPSGLVDTGPLQDLHAVLTTENIRRGYIVTSGQFTSGANEFAEEKHLTLLPGDVFLEKLNALPDAARSEMMQASAARA